MFRTSYDVKQSLTINASLARVWKHIATLEQQSQWSPWMIMEPDAQNEFSGKDGVVGSTQRWSGTRIGSGEQMISSVVEEHSVTTIITFLTPWKCHATASLLLDAIDSTTTQITWTLESNLPLFAFWMKKKMIAYIENDYMRGLVLLKELIEEGAIHTQTIYDGEVDVDSLSGIGLANFCTKQEMPTIMKQDFATLVAYAKASNLPLTGCFSLYIKSDLIKGTFQFVSCLEADTTELQSLPAPMQTYNTQAGKHLRVTHHGDYKHLGNSRSALYGAAIALKKKINKKLPVYEKYIIGPRQSDDATTWITEIYLPLK